MKRDDPQGKPPTQRTRVVSDMEELENLRLEMPDDAGSGSSEAVVVGDAPAHPATVWNAEQEFQLLRGLTCAVTSELDSERLFRTILNEAIHALGAQRGILFLGRADAAGLVPVRAQNLQGKELQSIEKVSRTILAQGRGGELVLTTDAVSDPRFANVASVKLHRMRSVLCAPLTSPSGPVGALYLDAETPDAFPDGSARLIGAIAAVAATALENARIHGELIAENTRLRAMEPSTDRIWDRLIGESPAMERLRRQAALAAAMEAPICILGEPGSGRRLLARTIHDAGRRARDAFVLCDCAVVPRSFLGGMILGRIGAAARGARAPEIGLARQADKGTLYLTNAEQVDEDLAAGLAEILEEALLRPLGARREERIDLRLIVATGPNASGRATCGSLPTILAERTGDLQLTVPPLRERIEDIPALAVHFVRADAPRTRAHRRTSFTQEAVELLQAQPWPGNVRELRQLVRRIVFRGASFRIEAEQVATALASAGRNPNPGIGELPDGVPTLGQLEEMAIRQALAQTQGNKVEAAKLLGIHRNTLILKAKRMGIRD